MGVRGVRPLPTKLKVVRGTLRKGRANAHEPALPVEIPRCPAHLGAEAKREWKRVSRELAGYGLLTRIDRAALALYCEAWGALGGGRAGAPHVRRDDQGAERLPDAEPVPRDRQQGHGADPRAAHGVRDVSIEPDARARRRGGWTRTTRWSGCCAER